MYKKTLTLFVLLLMFSVNIFAEDNLINNGGWLLGWARPSGVWSLDPEVNNSLKIVNQAGQDTIIQQIVKLEPDTDYHFSCWMKGADIVAGDKPWNGARVYLVDGSNTFREGSCVDLWKSAAGTFDWSKFEFKFNSRHVKTGSLKIQLTLRNASGAVWYKDVILEKVKIAQDVALGGKLFPVDFQNQTYSVCEGLPGMLLLDVSGDRTLVEKSGLELVLDLPPDFEFKGACPWIIGKDTKGNFAFTPEKYSASEIKKNGIEYRRYVVAIHDSVIRRMQLRSYTWGNFDRIFIAARPGSSGRSGDVFWSLRSGKLSTKESQFRLTALPCPEKPVRQTDKFGLMISYLWSQTIPFDDISKANRLYWKSLTVLPRTMQLAEWNIFPDAIHACIENDFKSSIIIASLAGATPLIGELIQGMSSGKLLDKIPPLIDDKGIPVKGAVAPYYLAEDPEGLIWDKYFPEALKVRQQKISTPEMIIYDCEPGAMGHGYSLEDRKRFAAYAKLDHVPEIAEIKSQYASKWFDFRVYQHSLIIKKFCYSVHKYFPGVTAVINSDPVHVTPPPLSIWCGVDVRLSDNDIDLHMNMPYYSGLLFYNDIELNNKILKKKNFPLIDPTENLIGFYQRYSPLAVKQNIVAAAALGCVGIGLWPSDAFDGRYFQSIAEAFNLVGQAEDFYFSTRCDNKLRAEPANVFTQIFEDDGHKLQTIFPDFKTTVKTLMHEKGDAFIITALNYNQNSPCLLRLAVPTIKDGQFQVLNIGTGKYFSTDARNNGLSGAKIRTGFLAEIPPCEAVLLQVTPGITNAPATQVIYQHELEAKLAAAKEQLAKMTKFERITRNNAVVSWSALSGQNSSPVLKLQLDKFNVYIDPANSADTVGWKNAAKDYLFHKDRGFLGQLSFYDSKQRSAPYPFELKNIGISDSGNPFAQFNYTVPGYEGANAEANPLEGLVISKEITLCDGGKTIKTALKFINRSPYQTEMKLGFRIKNYPRLGGSFAGMKTLSDIVTIKHFSHSGVKNVPSDQSGSILLLSDKNSELSVLKGAVKSESWTPGPITVEASGGGLKETMVFDAMPELTAGCMIRKSNHDYTVEMLSSEFVLPFGKTADYDYIISLK